MGDVSHTDRRWSGSANGRFAPALKAIVALMGTDDLCQDDVHFIEGVLHFDSHEIGQDIENAVPGARTA